MTWQAMMSGQRLHDHRIVAVVRDLRSAASPSLLRPSHLVSASAPRGWIHMAYEGEWKGHRQGSFRFTRSIFEQIKENFDRKQNPTPVYLGHPDKTEEAIAWLHGVEIRDGNPRQGANLWGFVEYTRDTAQSIRDGKIRYCSVVVDFDAIDRVTGEAHGAELYELGLTNNPFLDGQEPIALSRGSDSSKPVLLREPSSDSKGDHGLICTGPKKTEFIRFG